ncbi:hypothetical protein [Deinococcus humi]|uniref:Uncharacterized protein n=1 Tax=Deinococcus humi TaxID=662880 RepID=A0A7W8NGD0_9DEIO|nr:hypothetical protein [Deinococcus humi]MBB5362852.1 hypothetical protein [Deinococcus humi]
MRNMKVVGVALLLTVRSSCGGTGVGSTPVEPPLATPDRATLVRWSHTR